MTPLLLVLAQAAELEPSFTIDVWGKIAAFVQHPKEERLYALDVTAPRILELTVGRPGITREVALRDGACAMALSPDGERLFVAVSTGKPGAAVEVEEGVLQVVETSSMTVSRTLKLPMDPFSVATDGRHVYLSSGSTAWTSIAVLDPKREAVVAWWKPQISRSHLRWVRDRLYSISTHGSPQRVEGWIPAQDPTKAPVHYTYRGGTDLGRAGEFEVTADLKFLVCRSGIVLELSVDREKDLKPRFGIRRALLGFAWNAGSKVCYVSDERAFLHEYEGASFELRRSWFLDTKAYRMIADRSGRFLYAAVFPGAFAYEEAGGPGDIAVYDMNRLPEAPLAAKDDAVPVKLDAPPPLKPGGAPARRAVEIGASQECTRCEGKKKVSWTKTEDRVRTQYTGDCPACHGAGSLESISCPACDGRGKEYVHTTILVRGTPLFVSEWMDCGRCEGRQWVTASPEARARAEGKDSVACAPCHGKGKIKVHYKTAGREGDIESQCASCKGRKVVALESCKGCRGTGTGTQDRTVIVGGTPVQVTSIGTCAACEGDGWAPRVEE